MHWVHDLQAAVDDLASDLVCSLLMDVEVVGGESDQLDVVEGCHRRGAQESDACT